MADLLTTMYPCALDTLPQHCLFLIQFGLFRHLTTQQVLASANNTHLIII